MTAGEFFTWWRTQLGELIPAQLHGSWHNAKTTITLEIDGARLRLSTPTTDAVAEVGLPVEDNAVPPEALDAFLARLQGTPQRIRLRLAPHEYLSRPLTLPRAAQANLAEAVGYQLPQLTPFATDQLLYACGETADSPGDGPLSVWLVAVPRQRVIRALALIGQAPPADHLPLRTPPSANQPLELSWNVAETASSPRRYMRLAWLGLAGLWLGVLGLHIYKQQQAQEQLDQTLADLRERAVEVSRLRDHLSAAEAQLKRINEIKQTTPSKLALLNMLTQEVDDNTWLHGLQLRDQQLTLRGVSSAPATLIETLEATNLLKQVRFASAITRDGRGQGDRFNISANLESPPWDGKP